MNTQRTSATTQSLAGHVALVTGSNSGIGFASARALADKGARVILACRDSAKTEEALRSIRQDVPHANVEGVRLDLSDLNSVAACAEEVHKRCDRLDLLINNAGVMVPPFSRTKQGFELQLGTNHLGHFALTGRLLPLMSRTKGARIVVVSSAGANFGRMHLDDLNYERRSYSRWGAYCQSKLANLLFAFELSRRLNEARSGVSAVAVHPGGAATNLQRTSWYLRWFVNPFVMTPDEASMSTLRAALDPSIESGSYWGPSKHFELSGPPAPAFVPKRARDREVARQLWEISERLVGVKFPTGAGQEASQ